MDLAIAISVIFFSVTLWFDYYSENMAVEFHSLMIYAYHA